MLSADWAADEIKCLRKELAAAIALWQDNVVEAVTLGFHGSGDPQEYGYFVDKQYVGRDPLEVVRRVHSD